MSRARATEGELSSRAFWLLLAALMLLAAALRFYELGAEAYWLDELHSLANAAGRRAEFEALPFGEIFRPPARATDLNEQSDLAAVWQTMRHDAHPPLYFAVLNLWRHGVGDGEAKVRSLSVVLGVLSLIPLALTLRTLGHPRAGLLAAMLTALAFSHLQMTQQARPYGLTLLLVSCTYWLLPVGERAWTTGDRRRWMVCAAYAACLYLSVMTHYFAGLALVGHAVYAALRFRGAALWHWVAAVGAAALAAAMTWLPTFLVQLPWIRAQTWVLENSDTHAWTTVLRTLDLPVRLMVSFVPFRVSVLMSAFGAALLGGCLWLLARRRDRAGILFACWFLVPVVILMLLDLTRDTALLKHLRYPAVAVPGLAGMLALAATGLRRPLRWGLGGVLLAVMVLRLELPASSFVSPRAREAATFLRKQLQPDDLLVFGAIGWPDHWVSYFYGPVRYYMPDLSHPILLLRENVSDLLRERLSGYPRIIVVSPRVETTPNPSPATHRKTYRSRYFWQVGWIYEFTRDESEPPDPESEDAPEES